MNRVRYAMRINAVLAPIFHSKNLVNIMINSISLCPSRFFFESPRGLFPNTEYVFDLELPSDYEPSNNDGEVDGFKLVPIKEVMTDDYECH